MNPHPPLRESFSPAGASRALAAVLSLLLLGACATVAPPSESPRTAATVPDGVLAASVATTSETSPANVPAAPLPTGAASSDVVPAAAVPKATQQPLGLPAPAPAPVAARPALDATDELPAAPRDLWNRINAGRAIPELHDNWVEQREAYYSARPEYIARMVSRGSRYLFHIVEEVERRGLPTELALLPFIESAFNPQAVSSAKASGMWQFIPSTGRYFDLKQNLFRDDRRSVVASTNAALDYLTRLHGMFKDWHLALAAYNWGEGNVQRAIARNRKAGLPTDYSSLRMPRETRDYVPKLQAIENILSNPAQFGLTVAPLPNEAVFTSVAIERDIDVALAARLAGIGIDDFKALNPQLNKPVILAAGTPEILLPRESALVFAARLGQHAGPLASWTAWTAPSTLRVAEAAERVGMTEAELREANRIPPRMLVRAGSTLIVSRAPHKERDVPEHIADNAVLAFAPDVPNRRRIQVQARKGDTLATLARRHRVSAADLAQWNQLGRGSTLRAGQSLIVMAPAAPRRVAGSAPRKAAQSSQANRPRAKAAARSTSSANRVAQR